MGPDKCPSPESQGLRVRSALVSLTTRTDHLVKLPEPLKCHAVTKAMYQKETWFLFLDSNRSFAIQVLQQNAGCCRGERLCSISLNVCQAGSLLERTLLLLRRVSVV